MSEEDLLVERDEYLSNGVHIGTKQQHTHMEKYIFHVKKNQLSVLNLSKTDESIRNAAKLLANYDLSDILVVGRKEEAHEAIDEFSKIFDTQKVTGRFMPGTLTNPDSEKFTEPELVFVTDPEEDRQAINEATDAKIPVVAIADSSNSLKNIDMAIPANNKAESSVSMVYYLLAKELASAKGIDTEFELEDFRSEIEEDEE